MDAELCLVSGPDEYRIDEIDRLRAQLDDAIAHVIWLGASTFALDGDTGFTRLARARILELDRSGLAIRPARPSDQPAWYIRCQPDGIAIEHPR